VARQYGAGLIAGGGQQQTNREAGGGKISKQTIKLYVGRAAAALTDLVARLLQPFLSKELRQTVIIENVPMRGKIVTTGF